MSCYFDLLNDDLMDKILGFVANNYEKDLNKLTKKVNKLKNKLKPLQIDKYYLDDEYPEFLSINYGYVSYCMDEYLFDTFNNEEFIILFNKCDEEMYFCKSYYSKKIKNPTYLDILILANRAYIYAKDFDHRFLEGLNEIHHTKIYNYAGIIPKYYNVRYFEFILCS